MSDDAASRLLAEIYGQGYEAPGPAGDLNSLGYALQGPAPATTTADTSALMGTRQAAQEQEPYEALVRLIAAWSPAGAVAHRAATSSNLPRAISYHNRLEADNPLVNWATKPFLSADLAATVPSYARALRGEPSGGLVDRLSSLYGRTLDRIPFREPYGSVGELLANHTEDTARILNYLNEMSARAPKYKTVY